MRVPHNVLRSRIEVFEFIGNGSMGATFKLPRTIRASCQPINKILITDVGEEQTIDVMVIIRPEDGPVPIESKVRWLNNDYRVTQMFPIPDDFRPSHYELQLRKWAAG
jgi:hypothetical protein